jgi:hypothetical protein
MLRGRRVGAAAETQLANTITYAMPNALSHMNIEKGVRNYLGLWSRLAISCNVKSAPTMQR